MRRTSALLAMLLGVGCGGGNRPAAEPATPAPAVATADPSAAKAAAPGLPDGYTTMFALGMMHIDQTSGAVILSDEQRTVFLPIYIGGTETTSITWRLKGEPFVRPLTHDLIDTILKELGAELAQVQVDDLRDTTYIGSILIRDGERVFRIDARPSDAIALATGNAIPIYVKQRVVESHGVAADSDEASVYKAAVFGRAATSADLTAEIEKVIERLCACADTNCIQSAQLEIMVLLENGPQPTAADQQLLAKAAERMYACIDKLTGQTTTP